MVGAARAQPEAGDPLDNAVRLVERQFPQQVDGHDIRLAAIEGITRYLDEALNTAGNQILSSAEHAGYVAWLSGRRNGIGVEFSIVEGQGLYLTDVFPGGPASAAELKVGDVIIAMNGAAFNGREGPEIHAYVTQSTGVRVELEVRRVTGKIERLKLDRADYRIGEVQTSMVGAIPCIRVPFFGEGVADSMRDALLGVRNAEAVVLDLRDNGGGLIEEMVAVAGLFLGDGSVVVRRAYRDGRNESMVAEGSRFWTRQVVLLVNQGTAATAEAFVAALREHRVGTVVGTRTAGSAALPSFYVLGSDLVLQLSDNAMRSPTDGTWEGSGLSPDLVVQPLEARLPLTPGRTPLDLQRDAAIRLITNR